MKNGYGTLILAVGGILLACTAAVFFLLVTQPSGGQWQGFCLLAFMEITLFGSLSLISRSRLGRPYKSGMYAVLAFYAVIAALVASLWGFIWPVSVSRFMALTLIPTAIAAILLLLIRGAGARHSGRDAQR